jgi:hypothetical protein
MFSIGVVSAFRISVVSPPNWRLRRYLGELFAVTGSDEIAALAAGFFFELEVADDDGFVEGLGHVVDGEGGYGGGTGLQEKRARNRARW